MRGQDETVALWVGPKRGILSLDMTEQFSCETKAATDLYILCKGIP